MFCVNMCALSDSSKYFVCAFKVLFHYYLLTLIFTSTSVSFLSLHLCSALCLSFLFYLLCFTPRHTHSHSARPNTRLSPQVKGSWWESDLRNSMNHERYFSYDTQIKTFKVPIIREHTHSHKHNIKHSTDSPGKMQWFFSISALPSKERMPRSKTCLCTSVCLLFSFFHYVVLCLFC